MYFKVSFKRHSVFKEIIVMQETEEDVKELLVAMFNSVTAKKLKKEVEITCLGDTF